jgi:hypothetical protein
MIVQRAADGNSGFFIEIKGTYRAGHRFVVRVWVAIPQAAKRQRIKIRSTPRPLARARIS